MDKVKYHPILFSTPMVQAIMENRKTQTRRIVKLPKFHPSRTEKQHVVMIIKDWNLYDGNNELIGKLKCPYNVGDVLWVRETWQIRDSRKPNEIFYKASDDMTCAPWKPSLFMPKHACRTFLKIKSIRAERLQDISEEDAIAEGVLFSGKKWKDYFHLGTQFIYSLNTAAQSFKTLWWDINGVDSWNKNPFVWVYEFEKIEKPEDFGV